VLIFLHPFFGQLFRLVTAHLFSAGFNALI
jgi:hypothetical protein